MCRNQVSVTMAVHVSANTGCNLGCEYCYEEPDREMKDEAIANEYDIDLIIERLEDFRQKYPGIMPGMHGGEPLLLPVEDLRQIYSWIDDNYEHLDEGPHIQTNGTLLRQEHIDMFKEFDVSLGISMDGPAELNDSRIARAGGEDVTRKMTSQTYDTVERVIESDDLHCGIIVVASKTNCGTEEKVTKLLDWMDYLNRNNVSGHYNPALPYEDIQEDLSLTPERLKEVWLRTWDWMKEESHRTWDPMRGYQTNLLSINIASCVNNKCDTYNAGSAKIIRGDGATTACGKTWGTVGDGVPFLQGDSTGNGYNEDEERYEMLKQVPGAHTEEVRNGEVEDQGGCKGCKFWSVCTGGCPAGAMDYDYRNRVIWCPAIYALYEQIEKDMRVIFPNIRLVTDAVEEARSETLDLSDQLSNGKVNVAPFAAMREEDVENPMIGMGADYEEHIEKSVLDHILKTGTFDSEEAAKEAYSQKYDESIISIDDKTNQIHADSGSQKTTEEPRGLRERGKTWESSTVDKDDEDTAAIPGANPGWETAETTREESESGPEDPENAAMQAETQD